MADEFQGVAHHLLKDVVESEVDDEFTQLGKEGLAIFLFFWRQAGEDHST